MMALSNFFPLAMDKTNSESKLADFILTCHEQQVADIDGLINKNNHRSLLCAIFSNSPYLSRLLYRDVQFARLLLTIPLDELYNKIMGELTDALPIIKDISQLMRSLRQAKSQVALIISFADLSGQWPLDVITRRLTEFAEISVSLAVSYLLRAEMIKGNLATPDHVTGDKLYTTRELSKGTGYVVLAMGKMGGYELNYSSDIDLIVLYDNDIIQYTGRKTAQDMFIRLTQKLVKIMQERTADGYVFRTDLRLRPDPGATAIALSMEGAEIYYQSMGLNWERAAMIKARPVAGDIEAGFEFLSRIKSFVWRKHLDYVALEDIYAIKKLIHQHHGHREICFAGQDIKLGHGGIREIEFYAQIFQLMSGGREPELRVAATCDALNALEMAQKLSPQDNQKLQEAYVYHRTLEHRLQMINDDQTHSMPDSENDLARITAFMGYQNQSEFKKQLTGHLKIVHGLFTNLLKESNQDDDDDEHLLAFPPDDYNAATLAEISKAGYEDPKAIYNIIQTWLLGRYRACRTERARKLLHSFIPEILSNFSRLGNPDTSFKKFDKFLSRLPSGVQFFSFIKAQPWLLELLSEIISIAPNLADQLAKRPLLLDAVLNNDFFEAAFTMEQLSEHLEGQIKGAKDFQDILDISRKWAAEHKFQIGVQILRNNIDAARAGKSLSMVADVILRVMLSRVAGEFANKHGELPGAQFAIFALGKLGGQELTTTSDLDLVFIYDPKETAAFSDGKKPLSINHYFARFSQQFINALTALTGEGKLYEVDMRLRPSGNAGPIAVTLQSFKEYQTKKAWTWEHLALTRGRIITGDNELSDKITKVVSDVLRNRKRHNLLKDTAAMREKLRKEFGTTDIWSIKHTRGGLVDIEFICQYLILNHMADSPQILVTNTLDQILQLKKYHVLPEEQSDLLYHACDFMQNLQVVLRLCLGSDSKFSDKPQGLIDTLCERFKVNSLSQLALKITETQKNISALYGEIIEQPPE
ncbi:MAG: bifunctional [glutamine synthetase] adenylyltransferase/[glutamine synthetase]-adenylyl-L-tyrosine phosphorylase [Emcibacter sp.]|nr:bifunctional [glutamine synthetase] adenylyltransferase/[glutamine synthetase]-adenylyl-L-tyrosine phosphorylase [Emcibacter sp.]